MTIPEGYSRAQTAEVAKQEGLRGSYEKASVRSKYLNPAKYGGTGAKDLEGFLFPDTFELETHAKAADLVQLQLEDFKRRIAGVNMSYARSKNLTVYDVVTIASMVEHEAGLESQRKLVAAVIYNRLHEGMPLGIDATTRFATGNYTRPLTESELAVESPYNTRTHAGLPPGPIDSPGLASIEAAAHPAKADYLYLRGGAGGVRQARLLLDRSGIQRRRRTLQLGPRSGRRQLAGQLRGIAVPRLAVLGHPVGHSRSPAMHNAAFAELGLGEEWSYEAIDVAPDAFEARVRAMPGEGFAGANVTVPHKGAALAVADELSETAREIGAANTLVFADGEIRAENTDAGRPPACPARLARRQAGASARRRRRRRAPSSGRCCARARRWRSGTAPSCAHVTSAKSWAASR